MGLHGFSNEKLAESVFKYFSWADHLISTNLEDYRQEVAAAGALQTFLLDPRLLSLLKDEFLQEGYDIDVKFRVVNDPSEPVTGVDLAILLKAYTHPIQNIEEYKPHKGILGRHHIKKTLLVQTKNLLTAYGQKIRDDQLEKIHARSDDGGVMLFFAKTGIEVAMVADILKEEYNSHDEIEPELKYDFPNFMYNFMETNLGDRSKGLYDAVEQGKLASYVKFTMGPKGHIEA